MANRQGPFNVYKAPELPPVCPRLVVEYRVLLLIVEMKAFFSFALKA